MHSNKLSHYTVHSQLISIWNESKFKPFFSVNHLLTSTDSTTNLFVFQCAANEERDQWTEARGSRTWLSIDRAESKGINGCWIDSTWTVGNSKGQAMSNLEAGRGFQRSMMAEGLKDKTWPSKVLGPWGFSRVGLRLKVEIGRGLNPQYKCETKAHKKTLCIPSSKMGKKLK